MLTTLRSRIVLASVLWTAGLLLLMHVASFLLVHTVPMPRGAATTIPILIGAALMVAGFLTARGSLTPMLDLRNKVAAVREGNERAIAGQYPAEVQPLIDSVNDLLSDREKSVQRAHAVAGDLAHCLKTPLAILAREAESARVSGNIELADAMSEQIHRMTTHVNYHLARARVAASGPAGTARSALSPSVAALVRTLSKLYVDRGLEISAPIAPEANVRVREEDLEEILGNLLDNACKWARTKILISALDTGPLMTITVEDDGPGLPESFRTAVLGRGVRIDESAPGTGLGLSIVRDLVEHYNGSISLDRSSLGGLLVRVSLPKS